MNKHVSLPIAKLLKEKGFDLLTHEWYQHGDGISGLVTGELNYYNKKGDVYISAPIIAQVVMWLYEKHNIWLYVAMKPKDDGSEEVWFIPRARYIPTKTKNGFEIDPILYMCRKSPAEAYLAGIEYILKELL